MLKFFESLIDPYRIQPGPLPERPTLWQFIRAWVRPFRFAYLVALVGAGGVALIDTWMISWIGRLVDQMGSHMPESFWATHGEAFLWICVVVLVGRPVLGGLRAAMLYQTASANMAAATRWWGHRRLLQQGLAYFAQEFAGRVANRVMVSGPALHDAVHNMIEAFWYGVIFLAGSLWLMAGVDPRLILPVVIWVISFVGFTLWLVPRVAQASAQLSAARSTLNGRIVDAYTNAALVKLYGQQGAEAAFAREAIEDARQTYQVENRLFTIMDIALATLSGGLIIGTLVMGVWLWDQGLATPGAVAAASALTVRLGVMSGWLMWTASMIASNLGMVRDGMTTLTAPLVAQDVPGALPLPAGPGGIEIDNAVYTYGLAKGGIKGITLSIRPGERLGLVGPSGAGKSTLVNCLLRLYSLESGTIRLDGWDISQVTQESVRARMAMVSQEAAMLHRSVADNIRYGCPDATMEQVIAAAKRAHADEFIRALSDEAGRCGYEALVGERGVRLSGGQRQRVALARAILKDAPILVLDEATSALDSEVEAEIQAELVALMQGRTVIAIAHRLSTIAHLDRIAVMEDGRITELGTHAELLARNGRYARFWLRQSGGFLGLNA